ncbi:MerR family DNA-binding transcriptional regulator [Clostridium hydrogeniformans]|uniref:MerR family DNA-binding transcriptional regulator n=1 Tax=Clostridium hydrogeniformans TaxID=349933 RepID=UPI00048982E6|nr:MerR family DNA-binding transcriptional regulator [Clostridium hydrogeniformans]
MNNKKYVIGEFAAINQISTRMLRHYDKIGLIKPSERSSNGYRYYCEDQIDKISKIKVLKNCKFSLEEIKNIIDSDNNETLKFYGINKIREVSDINDNYNNAIKNLRNLIGKEEEEGYSSTNIYEISLTNKNSYKVLVFNERVNEEQIEVAFTNIFNFINNNNIVVKGSSIILNFTSEMDDKYYKVAAQIDKEIDENLYSTITIAGGQYISTMHYGGYNNIGHGYNSLIKYAEENKYKISTLFLEKYLVDSKYTYTEEEYITEISTLILDIP